MENIIWSKTYLDALCRLDPALKGQAITAMTQFAADKDIPGLNYEPLIHCCEKNMHSIRVNQGYRIILCPKPEYQGYLFLYVDQHEAAYHWARRKKISKNDLTGAIQLYTVPEEEAAPAETGLFPAGKISDKNLLRLGVPEEQLALVRSIRDREQLLDLMDKDLLSEGVADLLFELSYDANVKDLLEKVEANKTEASGDPMKNPETLRSFVILHGNPELSEAIMQSTLEAWRVFLHPAQRRLVERRFAGPALVLGGAGTGKTVTALHRAKALSARMTEERAEGKILYTFYTANLIDDIEDKLRGICASGELKRIDVLNIDKLLSRLPTLPGYERAKILYPGDSALERLWEDAISVGDPHRMRSAAFYQSEWENIVTESSAFTREKYLKVERKGGETPLRSEQREEVWKVFDAYWNLMHERRQFDAKTAMHLYQQCVAERPDLQYRHIIVDEVQDFSASALRLLRALAGPEHEDDIFLVGDTRQRIYNRRVALSQCGIQIQNRFQPLWLNYRTTEQLRKSAIQLLKDESFDDMNGKADNSYPYFSCTSGSPPQVKSFDRETEEIQWILSEMRWLIESGVSEKNICLTAFTRKQVKQYIRQLDDGGMRTYELKKREDRGLDGVRVGTMHRVKGLEFQYMFIAGMNHDVFPQKRADPSKESLKRDKCLLYVALTRAQKGAYVSGYGKPQSGFLKALSRNG